MAITAMLLLSSCSATRVAYNNSDVFLRWQAIGYFDFHGEQSDELDRRIGAFLAWHRSRALPQYARFAEEAGRRIQHGIKRADLDWGYDVFRAHVREALVAAAAQAAPLLDRLGPEQIARFERRLADENRKFAREQLQGTVEERRKRRLKLSLERLEEWFGPLTGAQAEQVGRYNTRAPLPGELRDRDRKRRQAELVAMLRAREAKQRLGHWASAWEDDREAGYAAAAREGRVQYIDLLLDLDRSLSPAQREHAAARLREYAATFDSLSRR